MSKNYCFPQIELLMRSISKENISEEMLRKTAFEILKMLESFGVHATIANITVGCRFTCYEIIPGFGVRIKEITKYENDIKMLTESMDIYIEAPIPGKGTIGINIPNKEPSIVSIREIIESREFIKSNSSTTAILGKDMLGNIIISDIAKMSNLLIGGTVGSGKTMLIHSIIMGFIYKTDPSDVKMIMIDTKLVDLSVYNGIPHSLLPVVSAPQRASSALKWAMTETIERYRKFVALGVRDIKSYNEKVALYGELGSIYLWIPHIVIIIDDLADLMLSSCRDEVEESICFLTQRANPAGIYLIMATQRPSTDIVTGRIKANIRSRVAFNTFSAIDSRVILEEKGAEKLVGNGDMLFRQKESLNLVHIQGAFVSDSEILSVVDFLKAQTEGVISCNEDSVKNISLEKPDDNRDDYFIEAGHLIIEKGKASIGMLQRIYKISFSRAARIMNQLEEAGVVGPEEGTKPRKIQMTLQEFDNKYLE